VLAPRATRAAAVDALVAFQVLYNHADLLAEQPSVDPVSGARRLHRVLLQALDASASDHDLGGYLGPILADCRLALRRLPAFPSLAAYTVEAAERIVAFQSLSLAHDEGDRDALVAWARAQAPAESDLRWWEAAAACGSSLPVLALIACAAEPSMDMARAQAVHDAYFPSVAALHSLLDSLLDTEEDLATGQLSLVGCYPSCSLAGERMHALAEQSRLRTGALVDGRHHVVLVTAMAASYLSKVPASASIQHAVGARVRDGLGALVRPALLVFALRRA
jgi:tetraprenyl-beta-curcumene synthase